jgi:hypothetical protein
MSRKKERGLWAIAFLALVALAATPVAEYQSQMDIIELKATASTAAILKSDLSGWSQVLKIGIKGPHGAQAGATRDTLVLNLRGDTQTTLHRMPYYANEGGTNAAINLDVFEVALAKLRDVADADTMIAWKFDDAAKDSVTFHLWGN